MVRFIVNRSKCPRGLFSISGLVLVGNNLKGSICNGKVVRNNTKCLTIYRTVHQGFSTPGYHVSRMSKIVPDVLIHILGGKTIVFISLKHLHTSCRITHLRAEEQGTDILCWRQLNVTTHILWRRGSQIFTLLGKISIKFHNLPLLCSQTNYNVPKMGNITG